MCVIAEVTSAAVRVVPQASDITRQGASAAWNQIYGCAGARQLRHMRHMRHGTMSIGSKMMQLSIHQRISDVSSAV